MLHSCFRLKSTSKSARQNLIQGDWKDGLSWDFIAKEGRQKWCLQNSVGDHLFRSKEKSATHSLALLFSRKLSGFSQEVSKQHNLGLVTDTLYPSVPLTIHWGLKYFTFFFPSRNGSCRLNVLTPMTPFSERDCHKEGKTVLWLQLETKVLPCSNLIKP